MRIIIIFSLFVSTPAICVSILLQRQRFRFCSFHPSCSLSETRPHPMLFSTNAQQLCGWGIKRLAGMRHTRSGTVREILLRPTMPAHVCYLSSCRVAVPLLRLDDLSLFAVYPHKLTSRALTYPRTCTTDEKGNRAPAAHRTSVSIAPGPPQHHPSNRSGAAGFQK